MRTLPALVAAAMLMPTAADAGDMYYHNGNAGSPVWAVPDVGGQPSVVFSANDFPVGAFARATTRYIYVGSHRPALVVSERVRDVTDLFVSSDLFLYSKDPLGGIHKTRMTAFGDNVEEDIFPTVPVLGQDDSFFSVVCRDAGNTMRYLFRIDVSVDDVLLDGYVPPTSFADHRVTLIAMRSAVAPDGSSRMQNYPYPHTWSPDGTRVAYLEPWIAPNGVYKVSARVNTCSPVVS